MYRMSNTLPSLAIACVAALSLAACNDSPNAPSNSGAGGVAVEAGPNGETLKVQAPSGMAPANDLRLDSRRPVMTVNNVAGKFVGGTYSYEFQLLTDGNSSVATTTLAAGNGTTTWSYPADLERDTPYKWRARARLGNAVGPWSSNARFFTVFEKRSPDPAPGQKLPYPAYGASIVAAVAAERPDLLHRSCQDDGRHVGVPRHGRRLRCASKTRASATTASAVTAATRRKTSSRSTTAPAATKAAPTFTSSTP